MKKFREISITVVIFLLLFSVVAYGDTWTKNKRLTNNSSSSMGPAIAAHSSNIYVVWQDNTSGNFEIYFKKSVDGGATWTTKKLTNFGFDSLSPAIAVDGSNIYVVWYGRDIFESWNHTVYLKNSQNGGVTWASTSLLTSSDANFPAIAVNGSNIYVVWQDEGPTNGKNFVICFKKSDNRGATWTTDKVLTNIAVNSLYPDIAVDGSNIYVVWEDGGTTLENFEIYFKKSVDAGATWTKNKRLTNNAGDSGDQAIAVNGSNIYVVWQDETPGNLEIYFKRSNDGGATWTANKRLTWNAGSSGGTDIAVDGSNIYVVWTDRTPGNLEIYFKKGVLF